MSDTTAVVVKTSSPPPVRRHRGFDGRSYGRRGRRGGCTDANNAAAVRHNIYLISRRAGRTSMRWRQLSSFSLPPSSLPPSHLETFCTTTVLANPSPHPFRLAFPPPLPFLCVLYAHTYIIIIIIISVVFARIFPFRPFACLSLYSLFLSLIFSFTLRFFFEIFCPSGNYFFFLHTNNDLKRV